MEENAAKSITGPLQEGVNTLALTALREVVHAVLFLAFTFLALLVLKPLSKLIGNISDLPVIHALDYLGGFALGLLEAFIILYLVIKICNLQDYDWLKDISEGSVLIHKFINL